MLNDDLTPPTPQFLPKEKPVEEKEADEQALWIDQLIDFATVPQNAVVVLKIAGHAQHKIGVHQAFARFIMARKKLFEEKRITFLFLDPDDTLEVLDEKDMNAAGWFKKEQGLIINPFDHR